jgi:hypothetical protein
MEEKAIKTVYPGRSTPCRFAGALLCGVTGNVGCVGCDRHIHFRFMRRGRCLRHFLYGIGIASALTMRSVVFLRTIS